MVTTSDGAPSSGPARDSSDDGSAARRAVRRGPSLSPSRANDFQQCPLLFRFRVVDRLPEPPSAAAARGTLVHSVLEHLYDAPAGARTPELAIDSIPASWDALVASRPELATLVEDGEEDSWLAQAAALVRTYFTLEDPNRLAPAEREVMLEHQLADGPLLRGIIDRLDVAPDGAVRVVDYKTGRSPRPGYGGSAAFQMRFYAVMLWKTRGVVPASLQLVYLGDGQVLRNSPTPQDLQDAHDRITTVWDEITEAARTDRWRPHRTPLCGWCSFRDLCPEFGGTPPEVDPVQVARATGVTLPAA